MTRFIAIPKHPPEAVTLTESIGGYSTAARAERIDGFRSIVGQQSGLLLSETLHTKHKLIATPDQHTPITGVTIIEGNSEAAEDLQNKLPDHEVIEDFNLELVAPTTDSDDSTDVASMSAWHMAAIKLKTARDSGYTGTGSGVGVAVLDTGVAPVEELEGRIIGAYEFDNDLKPVEISTKDTDGHGTGVAALIAGKTVGVAPGADIVNVITIPQRTGTYSNFLLAAEFIASRPEISVANISAGVPSWDPRIKPGIYALLNTYILPVVAVGNGGANSSRSPGNYSEVLSVGACREDGRVWAGSSSASRTFEGMNYTVPSLVAPGHRVTTCNGDGEFRLYSGSSLATPIVSGLAALIIEKYESITQFELREEIFEACTKLEATEPLRQGSGMAQLPLSFYHLGS